MADEAKPKHLRASGLDFVLEWCTRHGAAVSPAAVARLAHAVVALVRAELAINPMPQWQGADAGLLSHWALNTCFHVKVGRGRLTPGFRS